MIIKNAYLVFAQQHGMPSNEKTAFSFMLIEEIYESAGEFLPRQC